MPAATYEIARVRADRPGTTAVRPEVRLLIVADEVAFVSVLARYLADSRRAQYVVRHAETLSEARALLGAETFDLVLLDLSLPDNPRESTFEVMQANGEK